MRSLCWPFSYPFSPLTPATGLRSCAVWANTVTVRVLFSMDAPHGQHTLSVRMRRHRSACGRGLSPAHSQGYHLESRPATRAPRAISLPITAKDVLFIPQEC